MDPKEKEVPVVEPTPEELQAEQAATKEVKEEEVRAEIIKDFGFDAEADKERIDKLVVRETEHRKKLGSAIGQKIKHREALKALGKKPETPPEPKNKGNAHEDIDTKISEGLNKAFETRDLGAMPYPDDLKKEIKRVAEIQGVSIAEAVADPYIASKIETWKKEHAADAASISRTHQQGGGSFNDGDFDPNRPPNVDMKTKEGREAYDRWFEKARKVR